MISNFGRQPAIVLVDDDFHSARLMMRMLAAHAGPPVEWMEDSAAALEALSAFASLPAKDGQFTMVIVDLKSSSVATRDFIVSLKQAAPKLLLIAMAPSLDRDVINGTGPENTRINVPVLSHDYFIGVHMFSYDAGSTVTTTMRLYCGGTLSSTATRAFSTTREFWVPGQVHFNTDGGCTYTSLNKVFQKP